jgi:hypothetical protein
MLILYVNHSILFLVAIKNLMATRCNLMMDVKMYFATCSRFFLIINIWWPRRNLMMDVNMHFITCYRLF